MKYEIAAMFRWLTGSPDSVVRCLQYAKIMIATKKGILDRGCILTCKCNILWSPTLGRVSISAFQWRHGLVS